MTSPAPVHTPVLLNETLDLLDVREGGVFIDCTTGLGGHSFAIAEKMGETGRLLCLDQDREALEFARARLAPFGRRVRFVHANFRELADVAAREGFQEADGILMDLGISSFQLGEARRGFAFALKGPLDMRMDPDSGGITAGGIVNTWEESSLADLFYQLGEERQSRRIARSILYNRPLHTTWDLARSVEQALGGTRRQTHIHPATKVFQALRLYVNGELDTLNVALPLAQSLLGSGNSHGGRLAVISFHSLEDRIVKQYFRRESTQCICPPGMPECRCGHVATLRELTRKAVRPSEAEVAGNPRSRSAVLRAVERIN